MNEHQIEELADLIGPISTRKDRIKRIQEFLTKVEQQQYDEENRLISEYRRQVREFTS